VTVAGPPDWWRDNQIMTAMEESMYGTRNDADGVRDEVVRGYKPRNDDPRWVLVVSFLILVAVIALCAAVIGGAMR
jgi:hypothetical protein